ncbi:glycosyltransferase family A protein [Actinotalea sp. AC32]|nr:glycosyltransferase family A protein [Actinotalea sp. AC32]
MDRIAVLTPVYDGAHLLGRFRRALDAQTRRPDSIVVFDDGSTDGTREALEGWAAEDTRVVVLRGDTNRGRGHARQALLDAVDADFVTWLDVDDHWHPRKLEEQLAHHRALDPSEGGHVLLSAPLYRIDLRRGGAKLVTLPHEYRLRDYLRLARDRNDVVMLQSTFGRTEAFRATGFDTTLNWSEDFDFFLRFLADGGRVVPQPEGSAAVAYYHTLQGRDPAAIAAAHDHLYATHEHLWDDPAEAATEKWLRRVRYVLHAHLVNADGAGAERALVAARPVLEAGAFVEDLRAGARTVLKAYAGDAGAALAFAHRWANEAKRLRCTRVDGGYDATSDAASAVRWKAAGEAVAEGSLLTDDDVLDLYLAGVREVEVVERVDRGTKRRFSVEVLAGGTVGLMPTGAF